MGHLGSIETIKELLIARMPPYPEKRSNLVSLYGRGVISALNELMAENKVIRVKKGYYSLSDELLDERGHVEVSDTTGECNDTREFMPTETLKLVIGAWISQFRLTVLLENQMEDVLKEVDYYTVGEQVGDEYLAESLQELVGYLHQYKQTEGGLSLIERLTTNN